jgi:integrase
MNWSVKKKMLSVNTCVGVENVGEEQSRERVLSIDEIRLFLKACRSAPSPWGQLGRMLLLTGQRRSEVAGMTTAEVLLGEWTIPKRRTKNGLEHFVPLVDAAVDVLRELPAKIMPGSEVGYYFSTMHDRPVCGFSKSKAGIAQKMIELRSIEHAEKMDGLASNDRRSVQPISYWTFHDLRRTMATGLQRLKVPIEITEAILNHKSGKIKGIAEIYQRHDYADEKREALEKWSAELRRIEAMG